MKKRAHRRLRGLSRRRIAVIILILAVAFALLVGLLYQLGRRWETGGGGARGDLAGRFETPAPVLWNGAQYARKSNLTSYLLMGVDRDGAQEKSGFRQGGQADFLLLLVADHDEKTIRPLQIDRDTMAEIVVVGVLGNITGTRTSQICLAHGFGDGGEKSCEYTVQAVENLLSGMAVNYYVALDLNSIGVLNDALGGVTVTLEEDFSAYDPAMIPGATIALDAKQAETFVRYRMEVGDGSNASRMRRQRVYMTQALKQIREGSAQNPRYAQTLYEALEPIMVTDMNKGRMMNEISRVSDYEMLPTQTPAGEHSIGADGFMEFHCDDDDLLSWVIDAYFKPVE